ncbi:RHS repeat domain-containing protein [Stenotrophomonas maltophilia]|uniref:RHS repeat domain-containing protein n=1 Tax=Stenotrophomonas maltophilia TaxID=40324 RepID=UPI0015DFE3C2|nr:RHS repeat domain-containing protein [Stenotrophomonas maltophilia]MBA0448335.1 wall-associated protein [Stenotrophomonas maltophilia]
MRSRATLRPRQSGPVGLSTLLLLLAAIGLPSVGLAQIVPTWRQEYDKRLKYGDLVEPLKGEIFGEQVNLYDGSISFKATDISLPGNSELPVALSRSRSASDGSSESPLGDWDLDVPSLSGVYGDLPETAAQGHWMPAARCTTVGAPPTLEVWNRRNTQKVNFNPHTYWDGVRLSLPGGGGEPLLGGNGDARQPQPQLGQPAPWNTKGGWVITCLAALKSGQPGEGFLGHAPDGTKYYFDWMVARPNGSATLQPFGPESNAQLGRKRVHLYPSQIVDRFGNWVRYEWSGTRLQRITASDGREISLAYQSNGLIASATAAGRTWTYGYTDADILRTVTLPDGTQWIYSLPPLSVTHKYAEYTGQNIWDYMEYPATCSRVNKIVPSEITMTVQHPSGALGTFLFRPFRHGRKNVTLDCQTSGDNHLIAEGWNYTPIYRDAMSLVAKTISGPGIPTAQWTYQYTNLNGAYAQDLGGPVIPAGQAEPKITTETLPDGVVRVYEFGKEVAYNDGLLLSTTTRSGGSVVRVDRNNYYPDAQLDAAPFPKEAGKDFKYGANDLKAHYNRPVQSAVVEQDGVQFSRTVQTFDAFAREVTVVEANSAGQSRTSTTAYYDNPALWVNGQSARSVLNGIEQSRTEFDTAKALPLRAYAFGRLAQQVTYAADGTVASVSDGRGNTSHLSGWKRGVPQQLRMPATAEAPNGAVRTVAVDDNGWITSLTDETGATTSFSYDSMGRLRSQQFPTGDTVNWNGVTMDLQRLGSAQFGVPAGAWKHSRIQGGRRTDTYLDAMFRPVLVTENANNVRDSAVVTRYDSSGRTVFVSYPTRQFSSIGAALDGATTQYDALGRPVLVSQSSELGTLATRTEYVGNLSVKATNPRGQSTTTRHLAYDQPTYEMPLTLQHPEGVVTEIQRDVLGKPLAITRRSADGSQSLTRRYVYDAYQQLCKTIEPETGATVQDYDAAGNVLWSAAGTGLTSTAGCNRSEALASGRAVKRSYDAANRLSMLTFPDGRGSQSWSYTPDGLPAEISTQNDAARPVVINRYQYNRRRLLTGETLQHPDLGTLNLAYGYDANGTLASNTYPGGRVVSYAPDTLGRATTVGGYAKEATYFANGALARFVYGNGVVHTMTQNARGLPDRSRDATAAAAVLDDSYDYDAGGNVMAISDGLPGAPGNRDMTYDGLDRLRTVMAPGFGNALYEYDALDNLRRAKVGSRDRTHYFDPTNRLVNVVETGSGATVTGLGYDVQGNLSIRNGQPFTFDFGNRLRAVGTTESYEYDAHGRRVKASAEGAGAIYSFYDNGGVLRFQRNERTGKQTDYLYLSGSLVAQVHGEAAPSVPALSAPGYITQGSVNLTWSPAGGANRYELQRALTGTWSTVFDGAAQSFTSTGLVTGTYQFRVRGCRAVCGGWSNVASVAVALAPSTVPALTVPATAFNGTYNVGWSAASGAERYELQESANGGAWGQVHNAAGQSKAFSGKAAGSYSYRIRACNPVGCTGYSATASVAVVYPPVAAPSVSAPARSAPGSIGIGWNGVAGATRYTLQESSNGGGWVTLFDGNASSYATAARGVGSYGYRVAACNGAGCGPWSATATVAVIGAPTIEPVISAPGLVNVPQYSLSWSVPPNSESFVLEESANGGGWTVVHNGVGNSFGASRGNGSYAYRVRACNFAGCSLNSGVATVSVVLPPGATYLFEAQWLSSKTAPYQIQCTVGWVASAGATEYQLEPASGGKTLYAGPKTYVQSRNGTYCASSYRVRACNAGGCSEWSASFPVTRGVLWE